MSFRLIDGGYRSNNGYTMKDNKVFEVEYSFTYFGKGVKCFNKTATLSELQTYLQQLLLHRAC